MSQRVRWQAGPPWRATMARWIGVALALHVAIWILLVMVVRREPAPVANPDQAVTLVFAPTLPDSPPAPPQPAPPQPDSAVPASAEPVPQPAAAPPPLPPEPAEPRSLPPEPPPTPAAPSPVPHPSNPRPVRPTIVRKAAPAHTAPDTAANQPAEAASPAPPAEAASPAPPAEVAPVAAAWQRSLAGWLQAHKTYPEAARRSGATGTVAVRFTVERSGRVMDVEVVRGSGSSVLDAAAATMLRAAALPAFPASMTQDRLTVTVQLRYALTD